jgi:hypothetical protein
MSRWRRRDEEGADPSILADTLHVLGKGSILVTAGLVMSAVFGMSSPLDSGGLWTIAAVGAFGTGCSMAEARVRREARKEREAEEEAFRPAAELTAVTPVVPLPAESQVVVSEKQWVHYVAQLDRERERSIGASRGS